MATITGLNGDTLNIDGNGAASVVVKPWNFGVLGTYRMSEQSGGITGTGVVSNAPLFSLRWGDAAGRLMVITRLRASLTVLTLFATAQELLLDMKVARGFTASDSAGTQLTGSGNDSKLKTSMGASLLYAHGDVRIAAATLLTAGTRTLDARVFAIGNPTYDRHVNVAAGTPELPQPNPAVVEFAPNLANGEFPLILAENEGVLIRHAAATFLATGVVRMTIDLSWMEVNAWP